MTIRACTASAGRGSVSKSPTRPNGFTTVDRFRVHRNLWRCCESGVVDLTQLAIDPQDDFRAGSRMARRFEHLPVGGISATKTHST